MIGEMAFKLMVLMNFVATAWDSYFLDLFELLSALIYSAQIAN